MIRGYFRSLKTVIPGRYDLPLRYGIANLRGRLDLELIFISQNLRSGRRAIDVGSNVAIYSYHLSKYFEVVESFEPIGSCSRMLQSSVRGKKNINVHNVALSDNAALKTIHIPRLEGGPMNYGYSSISNSFDDEELFRVPSQCLDEYDFNSVDFIKIDVEGHELEVLKGAVTTIERNHPFCLIEVESRHGDSSKFAKVFEFMRFHGYEASFLYQGLRISMANFDPIVHQNLDALESGASYVNNFLFEWQAQCV